MGSYNSINHTSYIPLWDLILVKPKRTIYFQHPAKCAQIKIFKNMQIDRLLSKQQNSTPQRNKSQEKWNDSFGVSLICQGNQNEHTSSPHTLNRVIYNLQTSIFTFYEFIAGHVLTHKFICLLISLPSKTLSLHQQNLYNTVIKH